MKLQLDYKKIGNGFPVVLIHGFPMSSDVWDFVINEQQSTFQFYLVEFPGVHNSPLPIKIPLTYDYVAQCLLELLEKEKLQKILLVGHSMGGYAAIHFAGLYPERLIGLSMVHSTAAADSEEKKAFRQKSIRFFEKGELEKKTFLKSLAANLFEKTFAKNNPDCLEDVIRHGMALSTEVLKAQYTCIEKRKDWTFILSQLKFPIQWIVGEFDTATTQEMMLKESFLAPINDVQLYRDCGHMAMKEMPERLKNDLFRFWKFCILLNHV